MFSFGSILCSRRSVAAAARLGRKMGDCVPLFKLSTEELTARCPMKGLEYYVHDDIKGTEPAVDFISAPPAGMVPIYRASETSTKANLGELGEAARGAIDASLPEKGVVLLRGIPAETGEEFRIFWDGCKHAPGRETWEEAVYVNYGRPRQKVAGIDSATNIPPQVTLNAHNELSYNPIRPSRIALYCLQPSETGGESIIARNEEITALVSPELVAHLKEHGGLMYERAYRDANKTLAPAADTTAALATQLTISWQEKCELREGEGRAEAEQYWVKHGFQRELIKWDEDGTMRVRNVETGFVEDTSTGKALWFNNADTVGECADGSGRPPPGLVQAYQRDRWKATYGWRLQAGDWLVLDNMRVQHGRLPYPAGQDRRLLTVLTA